jgi:hypothetical protein
MIEMFYCNHTILKSRYSVLKMNSLRAISHSSLWRSQEKPAFSGQSAMAATDPYRTFGGLSPQ